MKDKQDRCEMVKLKQLKILRTSLKVAVCMAWKKFREHLHKAAICTCPADVENSQEVPHGSFLRLTKYILVSHPAKQTRFSPMSAP